MRIALVAAFFPPDVEEQARYTKELATRLSRAHTVTVVTYARLPESVPSVEMIVVNKRQPLLIRILSFTTTLVTVAKTSDIYFVENAPSVALPAWIASIITGTPLLFHLGDPRAEQKTKENFIFQVIAMLTRHRAKATLEDIPLLRPEILPFETYPTKDMEAYEASWENHMRRIDSLL